MVARTIGLSAAGIVLMFLAADAQQPAAQTGKAAPKGAVEGRLTWFDRQGRILGTAGDLGLYRTLTISPNGMQVAFERSDPQTQNRDIWLLEFASGRTTRFTSDPGWDAFPTWSPDGRRIVFTSNRGGAYDLYQKASSGAGDEELLYKSNEGKGPTSWSPDGRFLLFLQPRAAHPCPLALGKRPRGSSPGVFRGSSIHQHHRQVFARRTLDCLYFQ